MSLPNFAKFADESNKIEGMGEATPAEVKALVLLVNEDCITVDVLTDYVAVVQPNAILRDREAHNVRVGNHIAPPGGPCIREEFEALLKLANMDRYSPRAAYRTHQLYEHLHPYTDGNGRSGRALWLWMYGSHGTALGFLHNWYYQSLSNWSDA